MQSWFTFELNGKTCRVEQGTPTNQSLARFLAERGTWPEGPNFSPTDSWTGGGDLVLIATIDAVGRPKYRAIDATLLLMPMVADQEIWTWEAFCLMAPNHVVVRAMNAAMLECGPRDESRLGLLLVEGYYRHDLRWQGQLREQLDGIVSRTANWRGIERVARQIFAKAERKRHEAEQIAKASGVGQLIRQGRLDTFDDIFSRHLIAFYPADSDQELSYVDSEKCRFYWPKTLVELLQLKAQYPDSVIVGGGTELGKNADIVQWAGLISTEDVAEMRSISQDEDRWEIGAAVSLTSVNEIVGSDNPALGKMLTRFASRALRNRATLGGVLATPSSTNQLFPLLMALDARVNLTSLEGERDAPIGLFFAEDGATILRPGEVIRSVVIPRFTEAVLKKRGATRRLCDAYAVTRRRGLCEPFMAGAFAVELSASGEVTKAWIAYGGVSDRPIRARKAEGELVGRKWNEKSLMQVLPSVNTEIKVGNDGRNHVDYRRQLVVTLFQKFFYQHPKPDDHVAVELGAASEFARPDQPFFDAMKFAG